MKLNVIFEDKHVIVVVKPPGMPSQPDQTKAPSLLEAVQAHMNRSGESGKTARLVHRLDRPVGGIMVYAKTKEAAGHLSAQFADGRVKKRYLAVVEGCPDTDTGHLVHTLKVTPGNLVEVISDPDRQHGGQTCELKFRILATTSRSLSLEDAGLTPMEPKAGLTPMEPEEKRNSLSLLDVLLLTGRRHQIRVQLAASGLPILGDAKYNPAFQKDGTTIGLWSYELRFYHPVKRTALTFRALPPGLTPTEPQAGLTPVEPWQYFSKEIQALSERQA